MPETVNATLQRFACSEDITYPANIKGFPRITKLMLDLSPSVNKIRSGLILKLLDNFRC